MRANRLGRTGIFSLYGILSVLAIVMICPVAPEKVHADTPVSAGDDSLAVSISRGNLTLEADPMVDHGIALGSITISAKTDNETGYTMELSATNTALSSIDPSNTAAVPTLTSDTVLADCPDNRWGYFVGASAGMESSLYKPITTTATEIDSTDKANATLRTRVLTIGAKIDNTLPADTYSTGLVVSVVGNATATFGPINKMQEMTSSICSEIESETEGTLEDIRDGTIYQVGKMLDGRCWMLQNLALGSTTATTKLTSADSNTTSASWTLPKLLTTTSGSTSSTAIQSWDFGKWVLATPELTTSCGSTDNSSLKNCIKVGLINVADDSKFQPTYEAIVGVWDGANATDSTLVTVHCATWSGSGTNKTCIAGTYDPHYLVGNYYSWNAATAGTGGSITSGQASGSICPKGWRLPSGSGGMAIGSFDGFLSKYNVAYNLSGTVNETTYNITRAPLYFVRGGGINPGYGSSIMHTAFYGYYWSSTPSSSSYNARILFISNTNVNAQYDSGTSRNIGYSVRCINDDSI